MPHSKPIISVLIRSQNRPELAQALQSLAEQTLPLAQIRVLIADVRGISQATLATPICPPENFPIESKILHADTPLRRADAANFLLDHANTDWALFLDDDDFLQPQHLERLFNALQTQPNAVLAYTGIICQNEQGQTLRVFDEPFSRARLMTENYLPIHAALFRLDKIQKQNIRFDPELDLFEDWDFWLSCMQLGDFVHLPGISAVYRIHAQGGEGVRINNQQRAEDALQYILQKWRSRWSAQDLQDLIAYARFVPKLQQSIDAQNAELAKVAQTINDIRQGYENSRSWRITRPLREGMSWLREKRDFVRRKLARQILDSATAVYKSAAFAPLNRFIPASLKRSIRNRLMIAAQTRRPHADKGLHVTRPLSCDPLVSIIIPVYNHAEYLERCILSALEQENARCEVIVVNDASTDPRVGDILDDLADRYPRQLIIHHQAQNGGISRAQNQALFLSKGEVIAFLDCDDYLAPDAIAKSLAAWRDDTVYLHTGRVNVDEQDREINRIHFESLPRQDYFSENLRAMFATHLKMIRRDVFGRVGVFDPRFDAAQDYDMLMRIAFHYPSSSFVHLPEFLYFHRIHQKQTTQTQNAKQLALTQQIQDEARLREAISGGQFSRFISIIMLSYGKHSQTLQALQGLTRTVKIPHEIILYDNGSSAETVQFLREQIDGHFANLKVIYGERNLGPALGRREALAHASGEWFIIFDNDEIPEAGWLEELLLRAQSSEHVGAVCSRVIFPDANLQFSGGRVDFREDDVIDLALWDRGAHFEDLESCQFREVDWCPIGATLFTTNIAPYLHDGYPNTFEDAGVSFALKKQGLKLLNSPASLVWHEHVSFQEQTEMGEQYLRDRYQPRLMLKSVASFWRENGLLIFDEYIWRENQLTHLTRPELLKKLADAEKIPTRF